MESTTATAAPRRPKDPHLPPLVKIGDLTAGAGIRRVHMLSWRDLADVEAGGSEVHAAEIARRWAEAGLEVTLRTSYAQGAAPVMQRDGYKVIRRAGRYLVFPRAVLSELAGRMGPRDALVEYWNGMPTNASPRHPLARPRSFTGSPSSPTTPGMSIQPRSGPEPVHHTTVAASITGFASRSAASA